MRLLTVNVGKPITVDYTQAEGGVTGIDKRPVDGPVWVSAPPPTTPEAGGESGLAGDTIADHRFHGGTHQAVYAYAREQLDRWEEELGHPLGNGTFGENLTTVGLDVDGALIGERWRIGDQVVLEVSSGRIPCRTFAGWLGERGWMRRFTQRAASGAYLRVIEPGEIRAGDPVEIVHRPDHEVTVTLGFRAVTTERDLLPELLAAGEALHPVWREKARQYLEKGAKSTKA
ncbi:MOSC domain-containing protein [Streptomyces sp. NPDC057638]|uniref:MOSC domain-containing protein n=1 Tax=Streptomyces sp. NPDC057638 TaxID=3346190 RepID=UPI0036A58F3A